METENTTNNDKTDNAKEIANLDTFNKEREILEEKLIKTNTKAARALRIRDCLCTVGGNDILPF